MSAHRSTTGGATAAGTGESGIPERTAAGQVSGDGVAPASETLTVTDNRTGTTYELPVTDGTVRALDLRQIKTDAGDFGLMSYDPAYMNTASCRSAITYIDGDAGVLQHRGYPIEQLCEQSSYLEVAYLIINGALPTKAQLEHWVHEITIHTFVHENIKGFMEGFRYDANPMGMLVASVGALSTFYPDASQIHDPDVRTIQIIRLLAKMPTLAAFAFRHNMGQPYVYPDNELEYAGNFLAMMYKMTELKYEPDPRLARALDVLFILHADHEQNASTSAVRSVGSTQVDPYTAVAAGVAALYGPLHGGANEAALRMLSRIGTVENVPDFLDGVKAGNERLMGFGHRVYKNYDPRARIIRKHLDDVFEVRGKSPLLDVATELEKRALDDDYFTSRKLYPNVDFYSGLIYEALGLPVAMFPVMFAIGRTSGWIGQWLEMVQDPEQRIARPRQIYTGDRDRDYEPIDQRA
ncbi:MAG: citrate synthase [Solirubrobacterales bacterium]